MGEVNSIVKRKEDSPEVFIQAYFQVLDQFNKWSQNSLPTMVELTEERKANIRNTLFKYLNLMKGIL